MSICSSAIDWDGTFPFLSMMSSYVGWDCWGPDPNISDEDVKMKKNKFSNAFRVACFESGLATRALPAFPDESAG